MGGADRAIALLARGRHADRGRAVRGDRRLRAIREGRAADDVRRSGPVRDHDRATAPARGDHQDRIRARPRLLVEAACTTARAPGSAQPSPPASTASHPRRSRSRGQLNGGYIAPGPASRPAPNAARSPRSPPPESSPGSAGRSPKSNNPTPNNARSPSPGWVAARHARGTREATMSNQPTTASTPDPRQRLPTTNMVLRSQPANISLTRVAPSKPDRHPPSRPHQPQSGRESEKSTRPG